MLLVSGPRPWRATRWAWFWLMTVPPGTLLLLALSGPIVIAIVAASFLPTWWLRD